MSPYDHAAAGPGRESRSSDKTDPAETLRAQFPARDSYWCGEHTNIDGHGLLTHRLKALLFQNAQNFGLRAQLMSPTSSRKSVPPSAFLNFPILSSEAPANSLDMAKKAQIRLGLRESPRNSLQQTVPCCEGWPRGAREQRFLASAAFAEDKHPTVGWSGHRNLLPKRLHRHALTDDLIAMTKLATQQLIFFLQASLLDSVAHQHDDFVQRKAASR